jgi:hypothetical protein
MRAVCALLVLGASADVRGFGTSRDLHVSARGPPRARASQCALAADGGVSAWLLAALSESDAGVRYFAAGGICAAISHAIATPVDVVKTRQQTVPEYRSLSLPEGLAKVAREQGAPALFTGLGPTGVHRCP